MARRDVIVLLPIITILLSIFASPANPTSSLNNIPLPSTSTELSSQIHHHNNISSLSSTSYSKTSSYILREKLTEDDRAYDVKILPNDHLVSIFLLDGQIKRLVFPLVVEGPLTLLVTPCSSPLSWSLSLRPLYTHTTHHTLPSESTPKNISGGHQYQECLSRFPTLRKHTKDST
ncbi:hypothetical protein Hamer_G021522 [Homarus americanus]|uniref:Neuron-derived neurotrophic factor N-terminal domain-containing protein n=1 Tax=Homarus americanus TaxID=6706 RepID=A0A8J5MYL0_HOMAM|nr:hypothetical protein Hamer_G021522 [Homarus americanus]